MPSAPTTNVPGVKRASLRVKLTLWMLVIFLVVQLSLALVFQLYQTRSINSYFNERIGVRIEQLASLVAASVADPGMTDERLAFQSADPKLPPSEEFMVDVRDEAGRLIASTLRPGIPLREGVLTDLTHPGKALFAATPTGMLSKPGGAPFPVRVGVVAVNGANGKRYFVVAAVNDTQAHEMLNLVSRIILISIPIGLIATAVSAWVIAGIAVRPLSALRAVASQLSPESISRHLNVPAAPASEEVAAVQRELELARQRIEAGFAAQERFMSNVSHELKTPIATILTEVQLIKSERAPVEVRDFLKSVTEELDKLGRTVDSFLLLTRVRHGKAQVPAAETCYIRDVLLDSYESCVSMAAQYSVRIDLKIPEDEHANAAVVGNCDLLRIIFDNIIRNAIRFSPAESVIAVTAWVKDRETHISVRDRGPGIPPELLPRIFDRFAQAKDEERRGRGHGLGLEIALGVAELHSGTINVRNCDDIGCEFIIQLPLAPGTDCAQCEPKQA